MICQICANYCLVKSHLRQDEGNARILPIRAVAELSHIDQLEQISPQLVDLVRDRRVEAEHFAEGLDELEGGVGQLQMGAG